MTLHSAVDVPAISAEVPDWTRERPHRLWDPSRRLLRSVRCYQKWQQSRRPWAWFMRKWYVLQHRFWSVVTQAEISLTARIGGGLLMPHPNGIVMHPDATIGPNCLIFQQVTLAGCPRGTGAPMIGGHVDIGAGAKIIGTVRIGDHAIIGANAVVTRDVPAHSTAKGIPAKITRHDTPTSVRERGQDDVPDDPR